MPEARPDQTIIYQFDWKKSLPFFNVIKFKYEENQKAKDPYDVNEPPKPKSVHQVEEEKEDRTSIMEEDEIAPYIRMLKLIKESKVPGAKNELLMQGKALIRNAINAIQSVLKKLVTERYGQLEFEEMLAEDARDFERLRPEAALVAHLDRLLNRLSRLYILQRQVNAFLVQVFEREETFKKMRRQVASISCDQFFLIEEHDVKAATEDYDIEKARANYHNNE
jgi:hypothetical protein